MGVVILEREYKQKMVEIIFNYNLDVVEKMSELEVSQKKATEINGIEIAHKKRLEENDNKWDEETYVLVVALLTSEAVIKYKVVQNKVDKNKGFWVKFGYGILLFFSIETCLKL
jgi:hypothetical protein